MDQGIFEDVVSAVPTHQFRIVNKDCSQALSQHFPIDEYDNPKRLIMWMIGRDEESPIIHLGSNGFRSGQV